MTLFAAVRRQKICELLSPGLRHLLEAAVHEHWFHASAASGVTFNDTLRLTKFEPRSLRREDSSGNRIKMNSLDGYWVLGLDPRPVAKALTAAIPLAAGETKPFMIASDGYLRLVEVYGAATLEDLLDDITGVDERLGQLRAIEAEDEGCRRFLRFKCRDDATVLHGVAHG